ncbi:hypothetical protein [Achromobacter piechaudii]|uniref:hypothetical protein n=1 Tax=Achromobacter piechaudii TaxID=72556 RepID=UPI001E4E8EB7|nr:hypothetical protein [Achromobacter piechaudii]
MTDSLNRKAASAPSLKKLGIGTVAIMNIVAVVSLRGLPAEAEYGLSSIFYYLFRGCFLPGSCLAGRSGIGDRLVRERGDFQMGGRSLRSQVGLSRHVHALD